MISVRLPVTLSAVTLVALYTACASAPAELRYEPPAPGTPAAEVINAGAFGLLATVDGKETTAFSHSTLVSPGVHRMAINCLYADAGLDGPVLAALPTKSVHVMLTGAVEANQKYYVRCIVENLKPGVFLAATPNGGPLPGFTAL